MLLGNYSVLNKNPGRTIAGLSLSDTRANSRTSGSLRNRFYGEASVAGETDRNSTPVGYNPPYSYVLSPKAGGMASINNLVGEGDMTNANLAGGLNAEADLLGTGAITNAALGLIASAVATLSGVGGLSADIVGKLEATADLVGTGDVTGALGALADCVATLVGSGNFDADIVAKGNMSADITPFTELSPENLAASVWNALAILYNNAGTMGEKMNDAGSASNPWADTADYGAGTKGKLLKDAADDAFAAKVKP